MYLQSMDPLDYIRESDVCISGIINIQYERIIAYDDLTALHCARVAAYVLDIAEERGLDKKKLTEAGLIHDLGKIYLRHQMINKMGKLSPLEKECVDRHAYYGYRLLRDVCVDEDICLMVLCHHSLDALSYTYEEVNDFTVEGSLILKAADIFDATTSDRPYRRALPLETALDILEESDVSQWLVDHFIKVASVTIAQQTCNSLIV